MRLCTTALIGLMFSAGTLPAQIPSAGDRDGTGRVYTKIIVTITGDAGTFGHPASDLRFLVVTEDGDRISVRTNDAGVAAAWLNPQSYRIVNPDPYLFNGKSYTWDLVLPVKAGSALLRLSQANASRVAGTEAVSVSTPPIDTPISNVASSPSRSDGAPGNSNTQGFFLAPHFLGASLQTEDTGDEGPVESGGGFGLTIGYGFVRNLSGFFTFDFAKIRFEDPDIEGDYALGHGDLGVKLNFRDKKAKGIPYLQAAFTARVAMTTIEGTDFELDGTGFTFGGGLNYHFQRNAAFDIGLSYTAGKFDTLKIDGDEVAYDSFNANGARFQLGLIWYPFAR